MSKTKWYTKLIYTTVALALVLSFGLVAATPSGAADVNKGLCLEEGMFFGGAADGAAEWTAAVGGITPPAGNYMAELTYGTTDAAAATAAKVKYSGTLTALSTLAGADEQGMEFNYYYVDTGKNPYAVLYLDTDAVAGADMVLLSKRLDPAVEDTWNVSHPPLNEPGGGWHIYGYAAGVLTGGATIKGTSYTANDWNTLAGWAALDTTPATTTFGDDADVLYVGYMLGGNGGMNHIAYVDDITIGPNTYPLEPLAFDATLVGGVSYYKTGDTVTMTLCNSNVTGTHPAVFVMSDTTNPNNITIALSETGAGTGVFTGTFNLVSTTPGTGELMVNNGDNIQVQCAKDWGAGAETLAYTDPPNGKVDNTAPVTVVVSPLAASFTQNTQPLIKANFTEAGGSLVDTTTIAMTLDGSAVTWDVGTTATVEYTPASAIAQGSHTVTVNVSDNAGNAATQASWSFTVDNVAPVITLQVATPATVKPAASGGVNPMFSATITDVTSGVDPATVKVNLTTLAPSGGTPLMVDDGLGTNNYTYTLTNNLTTEQTKTDLHVNADDLAGNHATQVDITLTVSSDIIPPVISGPSITYQFDTSARPNNSDTVVVSATVTDASAITSVTAACDGLTGTPVSLAKVGATDVYTSAATTVPTVTATGSYPITITATDAKGNAATTSLTLVVDPGAYGAVITLNPGWNLISLPLIPGNTAIATVLAGVSVPGNVTTVYYWYNDGTTTEWRIYTPGAGGTLTTMEDGKAYWMYMSGAATLTVTGRTMPVPPGMPHTYAVYGGWNFVGFKSLTTQVNTAYLINLGTNYSVVYGYKTVGGYSLIQPGGGTMETGFGYWLWLTTSSGTIVPP